MLCDLTNDLFLKCFCF